MFVGLRISPLSLSTESYVILLRSQVSSVNQVLVTLSLATDPVARSTYYSRHGSLVPS
jgi:hypothetical protein